MSHPHLQDQLNYLLHGNPTQHYTAAFYCCAWLRVSPPLKGTFPPCWKQPVTSQGVHDNSWNPHQVCRCLLHLVLPEQLLEQAQGRLLPKIRLCLPEMHARGHCRARSVPSSQPVNKCHQKPPKGCFKQCACLFTQLSCTVSEK